MTPSGPAASTASRSWRPRWRKPGGVAAGGAVVEIELDLLEREPGAERVDRHPHLAAEAGREREARRPGPRAERAAAPRAARAGATPVRSRTSSRPTRLARPKPPPTRRLNAATARSASLVGQRQERPAQVGVDKEERARAARRARRPRAPRPCRAARRGGRRRPRPRRAPPSGPRSARRRRSPPPRGSRAGATATVSADPVLLVPRRDEDGEPRGPRGATHPRPAAARSGGRSRRWRSRRTRSGRARRRRAAGRAPGGPAEMSMSSTVEIPRSR